jgi:hypothetical protein
MPRLSAAVRAVTLLAVIPLAACAVAPPSGPTVVALPHSGESLSQFQADDVACRNYAQLKITRPGATHAAANSSAVGSAAVGTAVGAAIGASNAGAVVGGAQQQYDVAYAQCMTSKGAVVSAPPPVYNYAYADGYPYYGFAGIGPFFFGPDFHDGFGHDGFGHDGFGHGGFGHGGFSHGGFGHGGFGHFGH